MTACEETESQQKAKASTNYDGNSGSPVVPTPIPSPVLLPGLIGMGIAAFRRSQKNQSAQLDSAADEGLDVVESSNA
jgi:hypothetical protein